MNKKTTQNMTNMTNDELKAAILQAQKDLTPVAAVYFEKKTILDQLEAEHYSR